MPNNTISVPHDVFKKVFDLLSREADKVDFVHRTIPEKTRYYKIWTSNKDIVNLLSPFMSMDRIHPYVKDSILKEYAKTKKPNAETILKILDLENIKVVEKFIKPLGVRLDDGRVICWGLARDWKIVLLSLYERSEGSFKGRQPYAALLLNSGGIYNHKDFRALIQNACARLGIFEIRFL